jgi:hypothetical protein
VTFVSRERKERETNEDVDGTVALPLRLPIRHCRTVAVASLLAPQDSWEATLRRHPRAERSPGEQTQKSSLPELPDSSWHVVTPKSMVGRGRRLWRSGPPRSDPGAEAPVSELEILNMWGLPQARLPC